jgi:hypothetical protein
MVRAERRLESHLPRVPVDALPTEVNLKTRNCKTYEILS